MVFLHVQIGFDHWWTKLAHKQVTLYHNVKHRARAFNFHTNVCNLMARNSATLISIHKENAIVFLSLVSCGNNQAHSVSAFSFRSGSGRRQVREADACLGAAFYILLTLYVSAKFMRFCLHVVTLFLSNLFINLYI